MARDCPIAIRSTPTIFTGPKPKDVLRCSSKPCLSLSENIKKLRQSFSSKVTDFFEAALPNIFFVAREAPQPSINGDVAASSTSN